MNFTSQFSACAKLFRTHSYNAIKLCKNQFSLALEVWEIWIVLYILASCIVNIQYHTNYFYFVCGTGTYWFSVYNIVYL